MSAYYEGVRQKKGGYKYSIDAMLLSHFFINPEDKNILEIGTGPGIISIMLARRGAFSVTAVELQSSLYEVAFENIQRLNLTEKISLLNTSIQDYCKNFNELPYETRNYFDAIVCNPPYMKAGTGHLPPNREKAIARHELTLNVSEVIEVSGSMLSETGSLLIVHRPERVSEIEEAGALHGLYIKRSRLVSGKASQPFRHILVEMTRNTDITVEENPLRIYNEDGTYTAEALQAFGLNVK